MEVPIPDLTARQTSIIYICGMCNTGKTTFARRVTEQIRINQPTSQVSVFSRFSEQYPDNYEHYGPYDEAQLNTLVDIGRATRGQQKQTIVIDEIPDVKIRRRSPVLWDIFMNSRRYGITLLLVADWPVLPPDLRANIDYAVLFRSGSRIDEQRYYQYFGMAFPNQVVFQDALHRETANHGALVIDQWALSGVSERPAILPSAILTDVALSDTSECTICLQSGAILGSVVMTSCQHTFCRKCIETWYQTHSTCPMCRTTNFTSTPELLHRD